MSVNEFKIPGKRIKEGTQGVTIGCVRTLDYPVPSMEKLKKIQKDVEENKRINFKQTFPRLAKTLFPPTVNAVLTNNKKSDLLKVESFVLLPQDYLSKSSKFNYYYNLMLDHNSNYELIIYISVKEKVRVDSVELLTRATVTSSNRTEEVSHIEDLSPTQKNPIDKLNLFYFPFNFQPSAFHHFKSKAGQPIVLEKIKTVKIYICDAYNIMKLNKLSNSAITSVRDEMPIVVPGIKIDQESEDRIAVKNPVRVNYPIQSNFKGITLMEKLLAPKVMAIRNKDSLSITTVSLLNESLKLSAGQFEYYYSLELDNPSFDDKSKKMINKYRLILYIGFDVKAPIVRRPSLFDLYSFQIDFKDSIPFKTSVDQNQCVTNISLGDISTVGVCVVEIDPETSRGTETTVQDDDDDDD